MSQENSQRNRRLNLRRSTKSRVKATCRVGSLDLGVNLAVTTLNVSEAGIRMLLMTEVARGQEVTLTLESQDHQRPIRLLGNVAWCLVAGEHWQVGIHFQKRMNYRDFMRLT